MQGKMASYLVKVTVEVLGTWLVAKKLENRAGDSQLVFANAVGV